MNIIPVKNISLIVAMTGQQVIGADNNLPWNISEDLKVFKKITMGHILLMGRRTFESIGRPLPGRISLVISRGPQSSPQSTGEEPGGRTCQPGRCVFQPGKAYFFPSPEDAAAAAASLPGELFVIGGASVYGQMLPYADYIYLSAVKKNYEGNVFFPPFDMEEWELAEKTDYAEFELRVLKRRDWVCHRTI